MSIDKYIASCRRGEHPTLDEAEPEGDGDERRCVECVCIVRDYKTKPKETTNE